MTAFTYTPRLAPTCSLMDLLSKVVSFNTDGRQPFAKLTTPKDGSKPFTSQTVLARVLSYDTTTAVVAKEATLLFPPGLLQEAVAIEGWTQPGVLAKIPHSDPERAALGHTVWVLNPLTDEGMVKVVAAFTKAGA